MRQRKAIYRGSCSGAVLAGSILLVSSACGTGAAFAQAQPAQTDAAAAHHSNDADNEATLRDIVVTARKRDERAIDVPVSITALGAQALDSRGIESVKGLDQVVPSVTIANFGAGNISHAAIFIRGIGTNDHRITTDPAVGIYLDGVYLGRQMGANMSLANIDHIEVLRGPQGTLSGRNTLGGAVNIVTRQPDQTEHYEFGAQLGSRYRANADFFGSTPVTDTLAVSLAARVEHRNGVGKFINLPSVETKVGEIFQGGGRLMAKWAPSTDMSFTFAMDADKGSYGNTPLKVTVLPNTNGIVPVANPDDNGTANPNIPRTSAEALGFALTGNFRLDDHFSAKVIGSERYSSYKGGLDDESSPARVSEFPERGQARQYTGEVQINGEFDRFNFVTGAFYFHEKGGSRGSDAFTFNNPIVTRLNQTTNSIAGYVHGGFDLTDKLKLSAGVRYTHDRKNADFYRQVISPIPIVGGGERSWSAVTWDGAVNYSFKKDLVGYVTVQRGYQSGGFPPRSASVAGFAPFNPTYATNYETGLKGNIGNTLSFSSSIFYTEYKDLVIAFNQLTPTGFVTIQSNAGRSRAYGAEFEGTLRIKEWLALIGSIGYDNVKVTKVKPGTVGVVEGSRPANTPKVTASVGPQFRHELASGDIFRATVNYSYRSAYYSQAINTPTVRAGSRSLTNFELSYDIVDKGLTIGIYGNNIFNKIYNVTLLDNSSSGYIEAIRSNDRSEFGIKLRKKM